MPRSLRLHRIKPPLKLKETIIRWTTLAKFHSIFRKERRRWIIVMVMMSLYCRKLVQAMSNSRMGKVGLYRKTVLSISRFESNWKSVDNIYPNRSLASAMSLFFRTVASQDRLLTIVRSNDLAWYRKLEALWPVSENRRLTVKICCSLETT